LLEVPFTPQAPFGNWADPRQDYACEEASVIMAMHWVRREDLTLKDAEREIIAISDFELKKYGEFHDSSAQDTMDRIFKDYFSYEKVAIKKDIGSNDIKEELARGNLVIVPVNGRKLENPFYTPPGPIAHMIVVVGYDSQTKEFITNDPGTKRGEKLRYPEDILASALQDHITGIGEPISKISKVMIVIEPSL